MQAGSETCTQSLNSRREKAECDNGQFCWRYSGLCARHRAFSSSSFYFTAECSSVARCYTTDGANAKEGGGAKFTYAATTSGREIEEALRPKGSTVLLSDLFACGSSKLVASGPSRIISVYVSPKLKFILPSCE